MNQPSRRLLRSWSTLTLLASASAAQSIQLSGPLIDPASDVTAFVVDAEEGRAYYLADQETRGVIELYGVPLDLHTPPIHLSDKLPAGGDVTALFHEGRSKRVVYRVDAPGPAPLALFSVMGSGNEAPIRLTPPKPIRHFELAADGTRLFYTAREVSSTFSELFVVPVDGSEPPQAVMKRVFVGPFRVDPTSTRAFWELQAFVPISHISEIHGALLRPVSSASRVVIQVGAGGDDPTRIATGTFSTDGRWMTYSYFVLDVGFVVERDYLVPTDGLSPSPQPLTVTEFPHQQPVFTADSRSLVFSDDGGSLFSITPPGSPLMLQLFGVSAWRLGPDQRTVFYSDSRVKAIRRIPLDGSAPAVDLAVMNQQILSLEVSPSGSRVAFVAGSLSSQELLSVSSTGGPVATLATSSPARIEEYQITADSRHLVYRVQNGTTRQLFVVPIDGSRPPRRLDRAVLPTGTVSSVPFVLTAEQVVYLADETGTGQVELFAAPIEVIRHPPALRR